MHTHASLISSPFLRVAALVVLALSVLLTPGLAPEPEPVPRRWQLDVVFGPLRLQTVEVDKQGPRAFYCLTYKVTNNTGKDLLFAPSFELATGSDLPVRAGRGVPADVIKTLIARMQNPLLQDQIAIIGPLQLGPENAREGMVIWPAETLNPDRLTVYAAGFSGETAIITPPESKDAITLRKTLMMRYLVPGELVGSGDKAIETSEKRWIMR